MGFFGLFSKNANAPTEALETEMDKVNPSARAFSSDRVQDIESIVAKKYSVIDANTEGFESDPYTTTFNNLTYTPLITDKATRIAAYRRMALYPEVDWCLREIANDFIHDDVHGKIINLKLVGTDEETGLNDTRRKILQEEFEKFIALFKLKDEGYNLCKRYLVEGEIAFENIIDPNNPLRGIIGVKFLPCEFYETLIDADTAYKVGIYFNKANLKAALSRLAINGYAASTEVFNSMVADTGYSAYSTNGNIPMLWPQVTYIFTGNESPDGRIIFPAIDAAKQPYHQLSLLHDAAVILRVTRAPERLVFNINTGGVTDKVSRQMVREFVNEMNARRTLNDKNKQTTAYNPVTMLESYYFWKSNANDGTYVESVASTASYDEIADIEYFLRRLFKQFDVPYSRYKTPENTIEKNDTISYEEYSFSRTVVRIQRRFAQGLKQSFLTHLKLRGIWEQYALRDAVIDIEFNKPVLYDLYQSQKLLEIQITNYSQIADRDELSKTLAMKKYLGYTDEEILENNKELVKEAMFNAALEFYAGKISEEGPSDDTYVPKDLVWKSFGEDPEESEDAEGDEDVTDELGL
jgi:hypothetical protein